LMILVLLLVLLLLQSTWPKIFQTVAKKFNHSAGPIFEVLLAGHPHKFLPYCTAFQMNVWVPKLHTTPFLREYWNLRNG
jgi:hypothetical protein